MAGSARHRKGGSWATAAVALLGVVVLVGVVSEAADWAWALHLRPRLNSAYQLLSQIHVGMTRAEVSTILDVRDPPYDRLRGDGQREITLYVHYSLFEGCYASVVFEQGRVARLTMSRSSEPGRCPGAPAEWSS